MSYKMLTWLYDSYSHIAVWMYFIRLRWLSLLRGRISKVDRKVGIDGWLAITVHICAW